MFRNLQPPDLFTVRAEGKTHLVLVYTRETARALGIKEPVRKDGTVHVGYRLSDPAPPKVPRSDCVVASRN